MMIKKCTFPWTFDEQFYPIRITWKLIFIWSRTYWKEVTIFFLGRGHFVGVLYWRPMIGYRTEMILLVDDNGESWIFLSIKKIKESGGFVEGIAFWWSRILIWMFKVRLWLSGLIVIISIYRFFISLSNNFDVSSLLFFRAGDHQT